MKKVTLFLPSLANGGAERVMLNIAKGLAAQHDVQVDLLLVKAEGPYMQQVGDNIRVVDLNCSRIISSLPAVVKYLKSEKPDAVLSALDTSNVVMLWAAKIARTKARIVVSVHCNVTSALGGSPNRRAKLLPWLIRKTYPTADAIVAVSNGVADDLTKATGVPRDSIEVLVNPVITPDVESKVQATPEHSWFEDGGPPVILGIGRLMYQKNFELLIRALAKVRETVPARLLILGEGDKREMLESLVDSLNLNQCVRLEGFVQNPYAFLRKSDVFVLSSRYEGLPTVLIEALFCGAPVISTDCPSGPEEILQGGSLGKLVAMDDENALAQEICATLAGKHPESDSSALDQYREHNVVMKYREVLFRG